MKTPHDAEKDRDDVCAQLKSSNPMVKLHADTTLFHVYSVTYETPSVIYHPACRLSLFWEMPGIRPQRGMKVQTHMWTDCLDEVRRA